MNPASRSKQIGVALAMLALFSAAPLPLLAQAVGAVRGVVRSAQRPVAGAQVSVVGTGLRAQTNAAGEYTLPNVPTGSQRVRAERVGFAAATRAIAVTAGLTATANFELQEMALSLNEIVVTGTAGATLQRAVPNAVADINAARIVEDAPITDVQQLINGRAAGVVVVPASGMVGTGSRIRIRGPASLSLSQQPLLYVDGVRVNNTQATGPTNQAFGSSTISRINDFNPEDIESIEIIKGPAAATLYGTEASNGVIQIITKKGVQGQPRWSATIRQGANWFRDPAERLWTNYARNPANNEILTIDYNQLQDLYGRDIFQTGHLQEYDASVSGGSSGVRYYIGGNYERNQGIEESNSLRRFSGRANVSFYPSSTVDVTASTGYVSGRTNLSLEAGGGGTTWSTFWMNPLNALPLANGQPNPRRGFHSATPAAYFHAFQDWQDLDRFTGSFQVNHRPSGWFSQRFALGTDLTVEENNELVERIDDPEVQFFFGPGTIRGYKDVTSREVYFNTLDYSGTATFDLRPGLASSTSFGSQFYRRYSERVNSYGEDFPARGLRTVDAASTRRGGEDYVENTTVGVFVQEQLAWRDRLFLTAAVRADDNSAFGEEFDLVYYPKVGASWVVSEEPFWRWDAVDQLRFRAAYGETGQQPEAFTALRTFAPVAGPGDVGTVTPQALGNPELGPERGKELELGMDAAFFGDRLGMQLTYYNSRTEDAIVLQPIAPSTGFSGAQFINAGEIRNTGVELMVRAQPVARERFGWDLTLNLSTNQNEVVDLGLAGVTSLVQGGATEHREGYPVGAWFDRRVVGAQFNAAGILVPNSEMCDDGKGGTVACARAPTVYLGRTTPEFEGSLGSTFTLFGGLRLHALFDAKTGFHKLDGNERVRCNIFRRCRENFFPLEFVNDPARLATIQRGTAYTSGLIRPADFLKFRELSLNFTVPDQFARRIGTQRASVNLAGRNLFTWTKYTGLEPEASFLGGARGGGNAQWEQNVVPQLTQFVTTINLTF